MSGATSLVSIHCWTLYTRKSQRCQSSALYDIAQADFQFQKYIKDLVNGHSEAFRNESGLVRTWLIQFHNKECSAHPISLRNCAMPAQSLGHIWLFVTPWTWRGAHQTPRSMRFPRQEYWTGLPFPSPGNLPNPGIEPMSPALAGGSLLLRHLGSIYKKHSSVFLMSTFLRILDSPFVLTDPCLLPECPFLGNIL